MTQPANTAARRLVETLVMNGIDRVFCVPGESYLAVSACNTISGVGRDVSAAGSAVTSGAETAKN